MSYTPNTWVTGDTITATKLNHMEEGIADGGVLIVRDNNGTLDKTWKEITDAPFSVLANVSGQISIYVGGFSAEGTYGVGYWNFDVQMAPEMYITNSQDGYPTYGQ